MSHSRRNYVVLSGMKAFLRIAELGNGRKRRIAKGAQTEIKRLIAIGVPRQEAQAMSRAERQRRLDARPRARMEPETRTKSRRPASAAQVEMLLAMGLPDWKASHLSEGAAKSEIAKRRSLPTSAQQLADLEELGLARSAPFSRGEAADLIFAARKRAANRKRAQITRREAVGRAKSKS